MIQTTIQNSCAVDNYKKSWNICLTARCSVAVRIHHTPVSFPRTTTVMRAATHVVHCQKETCKKKKKKRSEWEKERERKEGERKICHKLCRALWMSFHFILTSFPWKEILLSPFCRWRNWGLVILIHPRSYSEDAVWQVQRYKYTF